MNLLNLLHQLLLPTKGSLTQWKSLIQPKKADYSIRKFRVSTLFKTVNSLKEALCEYFPTFLTSSASDVELGYITPGHGAHGKQLWICDDIDRRHVQRIPRQEGNYSVVLCQQQTKWRKQEGKKKHTHSPGEAEHTKCANYRTTAQTEKMEEVENILKKLKEKHTI